MELVNFQLLTSLCLVFKWLSFPLDIFWLTPTNWVVPFFPPGVGERKICFRWFHTFTESLGLLVFSCHFRLADPQVLSPKSLRSQMSAPVDYVCPFSFFLPFLSFPRNHPLVLFITWTYQLRYNTMIQEFFQPIAVSELLYGCTILDFNEAWIYLFSPLLWVNSRSDFFLSLVYLSEFYGISTFVGN